MVSIKFLGQTKEPMKTILSLFTIALSSISLAQTVSYNDVAVIVNDNSPISIEIGNYFQSARNIPPQNMIHVFSPTTENIDSTQFEQVRAQIENYLINNNLVDSINYLVTTKGVPLKINGGCVVGSVPGSACASFDSELALILGPLSASIGASGVVQNPVFETTANFDRDSAGIFLVTRLDGYTKNDVFNMIDNSGPETGINQSAAKAVVDISNAAGGDSAYFADLFVPIHDYFIDYSWNSDLDLNDAPLIGQNNVFGYFGLGHGPLPSSTFNYDWTQGAVGGMTMCNSAVTFDVAENPNNDFLVANLIADGITGALGHVDYIYFSQIWHGDVFVDRYYDTGHVYNLAESYYMSETTLSWQTVIIGDPKASVYVDNLADVNPLDDVVVQIYPNPSNGNVQVQLNKTINALRVVDLTGKSVQYMDAIGSDYVLLDLSEVSNGIYVIQIESDGGTLQERIAIRH